ncbi:hypothetical protein [Natrialba asiatica]|uniref:hypothetical protein n=1 Tax=Natrialba asiatica TaxID=64602 RepID=UPI000A078213|nr:hypothetical protein [Natrialba asiatica]
MDLDRHAAERRRFARLLGTDGDPGSGLPIGAGSRRHPVRASGSPSRLGSDPKSNSNSNSDSDLDPDPDSNPDAITHHAASTPEQEAPTSGTKRED